MQTHDESSILDRKALLALVDASQAINSELKLDAVFQRIAEHAAEVLEAEGSSVLLYDSERHELVFQVAVVPGPGSLVGERFSADLGIAGNALKTGRAIRVDDVRQNRHFFPGIDAKTRVRTRSIMAAPLVHQGKVLGVVEVLNPRNRDHFDQRDMELLQLFGNMAAAAAANAQAYEGLVRGMRGRDKPMPAHKLIGRSEPITRATELCRKVAISNATVLLNGETGTGKELAARAIHDLSPRHDRAFIAVNCAALPETLLESELFGHEKGAFTGAAQRKLGRFELADGGTLFLDEIGEISPAIQVKLLRVLQEREFVRVGGTQTITCDVRIIAATNRDLKEEMQAERFREDLFYRLNVFPITLPTLREHIEDLPLLVEHFIGQLRPGPNTAPLKVSEAAITCLMNYAWPGNVRELRNVIERCALLAGDEGITPQTLPTEVLAAPGMSKAAPPSPFPADSHSMLKTQEKAMILQALNEAKWNQSAAARALGISRDHLRYRVKKYQLTPPKGA